MSPFLWTRWLGPHQSQGLNRAWSMPASLIPVLLLMTGLGKSLGLSRPGRTLREVYSGLEKGARAQEWAFQAICRAAGLQQAPGGGATSPAETAALPVPPGTVAVTLAQVRGASLRSNQCPGEGNHLDPG